MPRGGRLAIETRNVTLDPSFAATAGVPAGEYVLLTVSDNGVGMDLAHEGARLRALLHDERARERQRARHGHRPRSRRSERRPRRGRERARPRCYIQDPSAGGDEAGVDRQTRQRPARAKRVVVRRSFSSRTKPRSESWRATSWHRTVTPSSRRRTGKMLYEWLRITRGRSTSSCPTWSCRTWVAHSWPSS